MNARGFTLIELLLSCLVLVAVTAGIVSIAIPARNAFERTLNATEASAGARAALERIASDIREAGGSADVAAVRMTDLLPVATSIASVDSALLSSPGRALTITRPGIGQGLLLADVTAGTATLPLDPVKRCPRIGVACGFAPGERGIIFDTARAVPFTVAAVSAGPFVHLAQGLPYAFRAGAVVTAIAPVTYGARTAVDGSMRLVRQYEGGAEQPLLSNVVDFEVTLLGTPVPPRAQLDPVRATYGPAPPAASEDDVRDLWAAGENCTTARDAAQQPISRLADLTLSSNLVTLTTASLVDGPWCADALDPWRFDADLLRIRAIELRLRVEAASAALRGPLPHLFRRPGSQPDAARWVPDVEMRMITGVRSAPG